MKKAAVILVLFVVGLGAGFAQDGGSETALHIDLGPTITGLISGGIGAGVGIEFGSGGGAFYLGAQFVTYSAFGASATIVLLVPQYRFYFFGNALDELYLGVGGLIGYTNVSVLGLNYSGLSAAAMAQLGYKFNLGGFFLEPYVGLSFGTVGFAPLYGFDLGFFL